MLVLIGSTSLVHENAANSFLNIDDLEQTLSFCRRNLEVPRNEIRE